MKIEKKINFYLLISVILLLFFYILSFFVNNNAKDNRKPVKTALINKKYEDTISKFKFTKGEETLYLLKKNNLWIVSKSENFNNSIPADSKKIKNFIKNLTKVINLYKISDNLPAKNNFCFDSPESFTIIYDDVNELKFGGYDFTKTSRYLMTGKNTKVYEIDTNLDSFLSTSIQNWCDPFLICKSILNVDSNNIQSIFIKTPKISKKLTQNDTDYIKKVNKLIDLRHGGACEFANKNNINELQIELEFGDLSTANLSFYATDNESVFNVLCDYYNGYTKQKYQYECKISLWTYNKIKEIML